MVSLKVKYTLYNNNVFGTWLYISSNYPVIRLILTKIGWKSIKIEVFSLISWGLKVYSNYTEYLWVKVALALYSSILNPLVSTIFLVS